MAVAYQKVDCKQALSAKTELDALSRLEMLTVLHHRHAHASGDRLRLTLEAKGIKGYTQRECVEFRERCDQCLSIDVERKPIERVPKEYYENYESGQLSVQDLSFVPYKDGL
jgi:hypothetical protein